MNEDENLLNQYREIKNNIDIKSKHFRGTLFSLLFKKQLENHNFKVSMPNVYILGLNNQLDILIIKKDSKPKLDLFYEPDEVLAVIELKAFGLMGDKILQIKDIFNKINKINSQIFCCYITLRDTKYKYEVSEEKLGYPAYCLFKKIGNIHHSTGDWNKFLKDIENLR